MSVVHAGEGLTRATGRRGAGAGKRPKLTFLGIDKLVENLAAILTHAGARTIRTVVLDRTVRLMVDQEEIAKALAALVASGAAVTILGGVVPIKTGEENEGKGCAFLSMSVRAEHSAKSNPSRDTLAALREIIKKHSGSFRLGRRRGEMRFSLYLPAAQRLKTEGSRLAGS
ncbi:MAG: hypothetical protein ABSB94_21335 [Syntrophorhabdales bacterium]|jgi:hypothetical protein